MLISSLYGISPVNKLCQPKIVGSPLLDNEAKFNDCLEISCKLGRYFYFYNGPLSISLSDFTILYSIIVGEGENDSITIIITFGMKFLSSSYTDYFFITSKVLQYSN